MQCTINMHPKQFSTCPHKHTPFVSAIRIGEDRRRSGEREGNCMVVEKVESNVVEETDEAYMFLAEQVLIDVGRR